MTWALGGAVVAVAATAGVWWIVDRDEPAAWLFSHTSASGSLTADADGALILTLREVDPMVTAFTDRPARDAELIATTDFVAAWPTLFAGDPPNAVLVERAPGGAAESVVLTLGTPALGPDGLVFSAQPVAGELPSHLTALADGAGAAKPAEFNSVSLFIDSSGQPFPLSAGQDLSPVERGILADLGYTDTPTPQ